MPTHDLTVPATRGTRPLGSRRPLDPLDEGEPGRVSPAMSSKLRTLISKLRSLLAMVPPELRGKIMAMISQAEGALSGLWMGDVGALVSLMERTIQLLNQLAGWGDLRDLRAIASRAHWEKRRLLAELSSLLGGIEVTPVDTMSRRSRPDPIDSLSALISSRF